MHLITNHLQFQRNQLNLSLIKKKTLHMIALFYILMPYFDLERSPIPCLKKY